jgi:two-component system, OmpR family, KDP operon response regulator KdpE
MRTVLVVDDEPQLLRALQVNLEAEGYRVLTALDGMAALKHAEGSHPDAMVLDLGLPDINGVDVITRIRRTSSMPIIVLSARHGSVDKVRALDAGADDYVTKPFGLDELLARLRVAGRRSGSPEVADDGAAVDVGDFEVDLARRTVTRAGEAVRLTPREWAILELLVRNPRTADNPTADAWEGLGSRLRQRDPLPARLHGPTAPQAGGRPVPAPAPADGSRDGLPVRAVTSRGSPVPPS